MSAHVPQIVTEKPERRCGHICVHSGGKVFVWGGYNDEEDEAEYIDGSSLWTYNVSMCVWKRVQCSGDIPPGRSGACGAAIGNTLYIFGGFLEEYGHCNDLYALNQTTYEWKYLSPKVAGRPPLPRDKFACWTFENRIIFFGGYGPSPDASFNGTFIMHEYTTGWNSELVVLQINLDATLEWYYPIAKDQSPLPRAAHGMARIGYKAYLFGGRHSACRDNDLHSLDLNTYEWSGRLPTIGAAPCGRSWHIFIACGCNHILMYGGLDALGKELDDAWILDVRYLSWTRIDAFDKLSIPRTRLWHSACKTDMEGEVVIIGGCFTSVFQRPPDYANDVIVFNFCPRKLQRLCEEFLVQSKFKISRETFLMLPWQLSRTLAARLDISENYR